MNAAGGEPAKQDGHAADVRLALPQKLVAAVGRALRWSIVVGVIVAYVVHTRSERYQHHFNYAPNADQRLSYDARFGRRIDVEVTEDGFSWPRVDGPFDSIFLELHVETSWLGSIVDPLIDATDGKQLVRHYVERGANGKRWLNLTHLLAHPDNAGASIALRGEHLSWKAQSAALHVLRAQPTSTTARSGPLLVIAPHPDDAEIAAFGLYSSTPAWVVTVTVGEAGHNLYGELIPTERAAFAEKARVRAWDSLTIPQLGGVSPEHVANLGFFDGTLSAMFHAPDRVTTSATLGGSDIRTYRHNPLDSDRQPRAATWRNLVADLVQLIAHVQPSRVALPHPQLDWHTDHQLVSVAFLQALQQTGLSGGQLLLYTNHCTGSELYPFGPSEGTVSIPPQPDAKEQERHTVFQSVISHALTTQARARKAIALQTEHDLAPAPGSVPTFKRVVRESLQAPFAKLMDVDLSYQRRAVRPNELFFAADYDQAGELLNAYYREQPEQARAHRSATEAVSP